eukprot:6023053-Lingulodinium_polyedra.AAC.1
MDPCPCLTVVVDHLTYASLSRPSSKSLSLYFCWAYICTLRARSSCTSSWVAKALRLPNRPPGGASRDRP